MSSELFSQVSVPFITTIYNPVGYIESKLVLFRSYTWYSKPAIIGYYTISVEGPLFQPCLFTFRNGSRQGSVTLGLRTVAIFMFRRWLLLLEGVVSGSGRNQHLRNVQTSYSNFQPLRRSASWSPPPPMMKGAQGGSKQMERHVQWVMVRSQWL